MAEPPEIPEGDVDNTVDRLSALPDCVLLHILSRLETKEAAVTSSLSTRWRNLFLSLPYVDLRFRVNDNASDSDRNRLFRLFVQFANRVLQQRNKSPIRKIRLYVKHYVESFRSGVESLLMSTAAAISTYKVEVLDVFVKMDKTTEPCSVAVPHGMFSSETLVWLRLNLGVGWNVPEFVWMPNLMCLHLISFRLVDENSIRRFLQGCPSLEYLVLILRSLRESEEGVGVEVLRISSPSLKWLLIWDDMVESEFNVVVKSKNLENFACSFEGQHKVTLDAPNLKSLTIHGHVLEVHLSQSLVSINEAEIAAEFLSHVADVDGAQCASNFFSGLQHVKSLSLSENIMKALCVSPPVMPTFRNLIKLELIPEYCRDFPRSQILQVLLNLFKFSPNLEVLIFSEVFDNFFGEDDEFDSVFPQVLPLSCVEHLKVIEIKNFKGRENAFKLVEYF
ncbi:F-box/LRR-repeat protein [Spatholobus suberectus]|nr:F-box/LRR-repeat protein [Spatholobus suberectus]